MHANNDNAEFMSPHNVNDVVDEVFKSLFSRYQNNLEISMRGSDLFAIQSNFSITNIIK